MNKKLFWTIKEASSILEVEPYVLRYWESCFKEIKPERTRFGHRRYREADIELLKKIKWLLYENGFTIKGVKRYLRGEEKRTPPIIEEIKNELIDILERL